MEIATLDSAVTTAAGMASGLHRGKTEAPSVLIGHAKLVLLHAIFQPTLEWYSATQLCCRKIGSQDKHHRPRFTPDDEYEVTIKCKDLEAEFWRLWEQPPEIMSLPLNQLMILLPPDMANRMQEVFSVFLASFWILFVYLHRVCWWSLAHSATVRTALSQRPFTPQGSDHRARAGVSRNLIGPKSEPGPPVVLLLSFVPCVLPSPPRCVGRGALAPSRPRRLCGRAGKGACL
ncbi:hypothetical protein BJX62DRAFT_245561 [Aspergillus germanicus]